MGSEPKFSSCVCTCASYSQSSHSPSRKPALTCRVWAGAAGQRRENHRVLASMQGHLPTAHPRSHGGYSRTVCGSQTRPPIPLLKILLLSTCPGLFHL